MAEMIDNWDCDLKLQKDVNNDTALTLCAEFGDEKMMSYLLFEPNLFSAFKTSVISISSAKFKIKLAEIFSQCLIKNFDDKFGEIYR